MPEGDTLHRAAARLSPALVGRRLRGFEVRKLRGSRPRVGETLDAVVARGKHLLIEFSGGLTLDTHLGMSGSWVLVAPDERPRKPPHLLRVRLVVDGAEAHCFSAPTIRTFPTASVRTPLDHLGPDLMVEAVDLDDCLDRWARLAPAGATLADVLLDQRIANGVGNVFMSETCWRAAVHPATLAAGLANGDRRRMLAIAAQLLGAQRDRGPRTTVPGGVAVYGRRGDGCRRCGTRISSGRVGRQQRVAYWCPHCQPEPSS